MHPKIAVTRNHWTCLYIKYKFQKGFIWVWQRKRVKKRSQNIWKRRSPLKDTLIISKVNRFFETNILNKCPAWSYQAHQAVQFIIIRYIFYSSKRIKCTQQLSMWIDLVDAHSHILLKIERVQNMAFDCRRKLQIVTQIMYHTRQILEYRFASSVLLWL